ncbi:dirigent protein 19 [Cocos nucifera]|uniref:Dirigent protein n=1 Tax=Cocos nucifera TaxID=13894 RepID=A0A8K0HZD5_COCNU|nr:dirigent protein 19 [Cocos nucifera]
MAKPLSISILLLLIITIIPSLAEDGEHYSFLQSRKPVTPRVRQKLSHLRLFWHDLVSGPDPTAVRVAQAASANKSATGFGTLVIIDDALTVGPEPTSKLVGRAQGFYTLSSKEEAGLLVSMNFAFIEGKYNGSTVTILGRNAVFSEVREMPVIGGSGLFRMAQGYAQARTYSFNRKTGDTVVEYNVFVMHY